MLPHYFWSWSRFVLSNHVNKSAVIGKFACRMNEVSSVVNVRKDSEFTSWRSVFRRRVLRRKVFRRRVFRRRVFRRRVFRQKAQSHHGEPTPGFIRNIRYMITLEIYSTVLKSRQRPCILRDDCGLTRARSRRENNIRRMIVHYEITIIFTISLRRLCYGLWLECRIPVE
jgi:hypothetical protein